MYNVLYRYGLLGYMIGGIYAGEIESRHWVKFCDSVPLIYFMVSKCTSDITSTY